MYKQNKKGQSFQTVGVVVVGIMAMIFMIFAVLYGISIIKPSTFFTTSSLEQNATNSLVQNLTIGIGQFGGTIPTAMLILGAVIALGFIVLLIITVKGMTNKGGGGL